MKYYSILALAAIGLAACTSEQATETTVQNDGFIRVPMPAAESYVDFDTLYTVEKVFVPELTEKSVLKTPNRAFWVDSTLVVFDKGNQQVLAFDSDSKFLNAIGQQGTRDSEYREVSDIAVRDGKVFIFDKTVPKMLVYGLDGQFYKSIPSKFRFHSFTKADNGYWLCACEKAANPDGYALIHANEELQDTIAGYFRQHPDFINIEHSTNFVIHTDKSYFFWPTSNEIYLLQGDSVQWYATVDFGKNTPNYAYLARLSDLRVYESYMEENKYYRFRNLHICGDFVTLVYRRYAISDVVQTNFAFYNRKSGNCVASPLKFASVNRMLQRSYNIGETDDCMILDANISHDAAAKKFVLENYGIELAENSNTVFILCRPMLK